MYEEGRSVELDKLATALAKAQGQLLAVPKSGKNPHLGNAYSTLDDIIGAVRKPLSDNGLGFVQLLESEEDPNGEEYLFVRTVLLHESGQYLEAKMRVRDDGGPSRGVNALQALGAAITYTKRYALGAMLGIATESDTDGTGATPAPKPAPKPAAKPAGAAPQPRKPKAAPVKAGDVAKAAAEKAELGKVFPRSPTDLLEALKPLNYYRNGRHALNALNKIQGTELSTWPNDAPAFYSEAYELLTNYAQEQQAQEKEE